jgi:hypothetical protein
MERRRKPGSLKKLVVLFLKGENRDIADNFECRSRVERRREREQQKKKGKQSVSRDCVIVIIIII